MSVSRWGNLHGPQARDHCGLSLKNVCIGIWTGGHFDNEKRGVA